MLVGANNAGKSIILAAFRILFAGLRRANAKNATPVRGPSGHALGHAIDLTSISVGEENLFYNYDDTEFASILFYLSNGNRIRLFFPEQGVCYLLPETDGRTPLSPSAFRKQFDCSIGFVPILGPVDDKEFLFEKDAARNALYNYKAARNFRNIWYHFPEKFAAFRELLKSTWPGMDILAPEIDRSHQRARLNVYCPENRFPREIFWAGFGFQVWCQMLTHIVQNEKVSIFIIDEPDIYLHSDLQRQLTGILKNLGPDIIMATHSTEIIAESEVEDIVLIDKLRTRAKRMKRHSEIDAVFSELGSGLNPILTQVAKTRRVLFVEGKDFKIIGKFAQKLGNYNVSTRKSFAVIPVGAFSPERIRSLKAGIEASLGTSINSGAIFDRDYRCREECNKIIAECEQFCNFVLIHDRKEIENYLLNGSALDRALEQRLADRSKRSGNIVAFEKICNALLEEFSEKKKHYVISRRIAEQRRFVKTIHPMMPDATITEDALKEFELTWTPFEERVKCLPGKDALSEINSIIQDRFGVNLTSTAIISAMHLVEVPEEMKNMIDAINRLGR